LFIAPEGASEVPARIEAAIKAKCPDLHPAPFAWIDTCPALIDPHTSANLAATAKVVADKMMAEWGLPLALIVIDTIVVSAGYTKEGQDNDTAIGQRIMWTLAELSKATGAFVLGVDHFGKAVETGTRGSSAKEGAADVVLALLGDRNVAGKITNTRLALRKAAQRAKWAGVSVHPARSTLVQTNLASLSRPLSSIGRPKPQERRPARIRAGQSRCGCCSGP
jgi:hypothetical protein